MCALFTIIAVIVTQKSIAAAARDGNRSTCTFNLTDVNTLFVYKAFSPKTIENYASAIK
jgi:hypothetical protein